MLQAKHKLNSVQFTKIFSCGKKLHSNNLVLTYLSGNNNFASAVVVSKKQTKTAILRNYKRRVVFNVIKTLHEDNKEVLSGVHMIVMIKKGSLGISYAQILEELEVLMTKI